MAKPKEKPAVIEVLTLNYQLAELPSSQHRAGLAGVSLIYRWLKRDPNFQAKLADGMICQLTESSEGATLEINQAGLAALFDEVYGATSELTREPKIRLSDRLIAKTGEQSTASTILGVDVIHTEKQGNNVRVLSSTRIDPDEPTIDKYNQIKTNCWNPLFRRQRLINLVKNRPWYMGFDALLYTIPYEQSMENDYFKHDVKITFDNEAKPMKESDTDRTDKNTDSPITQIRQDLPCLELAIGNISNSVSEISTLYQQLHSYPVGNSGEKTLKPLTKGAKYWITPVRRELLVGLDMVLGVRGDKEVLAKAIQGLKGEFNPTRYGLPFAGDNNFLFDRIEPIHEIPPTHWYVRMKANSSPMAGSCYLTVGIDRSDNSKISKFLCAPETESSAEPPTTAWTWTPRQPAST